MNFEEALKGIFNSDVLNAYYNSENNSRELNSTFVKVSLNQLMQLWNIVENMEKHNV